MKEYINEGERLIIRPNKPKDRENLKVMNSIPVQNTGRKKELSLCEWLEESAAQYNSVVKTWKIRMFPVINDGLVVAIGREDVSA